MSRRELLHRLFRFDFTHRRRVLIDEINDGSMERLVLVRVDGTLRTIDDVSLEGRRLIVTLGETIESHE